MAKYRFSLFLTCMNDWGRMQEKHRKLDKMLLWCASRNSLGILKGNNSTYYILTGSFCIRMALHFSIFTFYYFTQNKSFCFSYHLHMLIEYAPHRILPLFLLNWKVKTTDLFFFMFDLWFECNFGSFFYQKEIRF